RSQPLGVPNGFRLGEREDAFERLIGLPGRLRGGSAHAGDRLGGRCLELPPVRGAGEVDSADVHVGGEVGAHLVGVTGEDVHHPTGHVGGGEHFGEFQGGQGAVLGGEDDGGVAAGDDRRDHRHEAEQRGLLGRDRGDDAGGFGGGEVEV